MSELNQGAEPASMNTKSSAYRRLIGYAMPYKGRLVSWYLHGHSGWGFDPRPCLYPLKKR